MFAHSIKGCHPLESHQSHCDSIPSLHNFYFFSSLFLWIPLKFPFFWHGYLLFSLFLLVSIFSSCLFGLVTCGVPSCVCVEESVKCVCVCVFLYAVVLLLLLLVLIAFGVCVLWIGFWVGDVGFRYQFGDHGHWVWDECHFHCVCVHQNHLWEAKRGCWISDDVRDWIKNWYGTGKFGCAFFLPLPLFPVYCFLLVNVARFWVLCSIFMKLINIGIYFIWSWFFWLLFWSGT